MTNYREILRLKNMGFNNRQIADSSGATRQTVIAVLQRAAEESRLIITHDKDFGALAFRWGLPATSGVILFRLSGRAPDVDNERILNVLAQRVDWAAHFSVVTDDRIRVRGLPG